MPKQQLFLSMSGPFLTIHSFPGQEQSKVVLDPPRNIQQGGKKNPLQPEQKTRFWSPCWNPVPLYPSLCPSASSRPFTPKERQTPALHIKLVEPASTRFLHQLLSPKRLNFPPRAGAARKKAAHSLSRARGVYLNIYRASGQLCCILWCFAFALKRKQIGLSALGSGRGEKNKKTTHRAVSSFPRSPPDLPHVTNVACVVWRHGRRALYPRGQRGGQPQKWLPANVLGRVFSPPFFLFQAGGVAVSFLNFQSQLCGFSTTFIIYIYLHLFGLFNEAALWWEWKVKFLVWPCQRL